MGRNIRLETEDREEIEEVADVQNYLGRLLPDLDASFHFLRFIDPYGDTVFNHYQIYKFLEEWQRLYPKCQVAEETELLGKVEDLAKRCVEEHHVYLRFIGD